MRKQKTRRGKRRGQLEQVEDSQEIFLSHTRFIQGSFHNNLLTWCRVHLHCITETSSSPTDLARIQNPQIATVKVKKDEISLSVELEEVRTLKLTLPENTKQETGREGDHLNTLKSNERP